MDERGVRGGSAEKGRASYRMLTDGPGNSIGWLGDSWGAARARAWYRSVSRGPRAGLEKRTGLNLECLSWRRDARHRQSHQEAGKRRFTPHLAGLKDELKVLAIGAAQGDADEVRVRPCKLPLVRDGEGPGVLGAHRVQRDAQDPAGHRGT